MSKMLNKVQKAIEAGNCINVFKATMEVRPTENIKTEALDACSGSCYGYNVPPLHRQVLYPSHQQQTIYKPIVHIDSLNHLVKRYTTYKKHRTRHKKDEFVCCRFSDAFKEILGKENTSNVQCIEEDIVALDMFAGYIEYEAAQQHTTQSSTEFTVITTAQTNSGAVQCSMSDNLLTWNIGHSQQTGLGFIKLVQSLFLIPYTDAVITAGSILGLEMENFFSVFSISPRAAEKNVNTAYRNDIPMQIPMPQCTALNRGMCLEKVVEIYGYGEQVVGAVALYDLGCGTICLPVSMVRKKLSIGKYKAAAFLLNQNEIDANKNALVIFCYDIRTAIHLDFLVKESTFLSSSEVIITGHLFYDLDVIPFNYLFQHEVIFIHAPAESSYKKVGEYCKIILSCGAKNFRVYPHVLLHACNTKGQVSVDDTSLTVTERTLVEDARYLADIESLSKFICEIKNSALDYDNFFAWGKDIGIYNDIKGRAKKLPQIATTTLSFSLCDDTLKTVSNYADVTHEHMFPSDGITTVRGSKNMGKSFSVLTFIKGVIEGLYAFKKETSCYRRKVLLVDSETPPNNLRSRIQQMQLNKSFSTNFRVISKADVNPNNMWTALNLADEESRQSLRDCIFANEIRYVFLDNLTTLLGSGRIYDHKTMGNIFEWAEDLNKAGVGVCFVHHNLENNGRSTIHSKARGSHEFSIRSHTEIAIIGKDEICENVQWSDELKGCAKEAGITLGLCFKTCKAAAILEGSVFWRHLPYNASHWQNIMVTDLEGEIVTDVRTIDTVPHDDAFLTEQEKDVPTLEGTGRDYEEKSLNDVEGTSSDQQNIPLPPLSIEAKNLLKHMETNTIKSIKRSEIMSSMEYTESVTRRLIQELIEHKFFIKNGEGKGTYYTFSPKP